MCGIIGCLGDNIEPGLALSMSNMLRHRGPDSHGEWKEGDVWLAHRRLAIIDLSNAGHQPMISPCGRYILTFNGEIYNYKSLREELRSEGCSFKSNSDTEVVLFACIKWGVKTAAKRFEGMFAFGLYDKSERTLCLVRDPMGIKPLYYSHSGSRFAFSSELSPLLKLSWLDSAIDEEALFYYFRYLCVPAPISIISGTKKLPSGSILTFKNARMNIATYWDLEKVSAHARQAASPISLSEATQELETKLTHSIQQHMQSDVPYGAFLSGGIDSSLIVALMQQVSNQPVKTFSIGFAEESHDESDAARNVATHLGTDHHEMILGAEDMIGLVPTVMDMFDEPFADNSSIPTYLVSKFAREKVTVCLSGDGGDELFGGYPRYFWAKRIEKIRKRLTPAGSKTLASLLHMVPSVFWDKLINPALGYRYSGSGGLAHRVERFGSYVGSNRQLAYANTMSVWNDPSQLLDFTPAQCRGPETHSYPNYLWSEEMMLIDQLNYLQDDILTKVDRASMAVSLETRVPLLTPTMVEWSWQLDSSLKLAERGDRGKLVLRELLDRYVPRELTDRPKQGFGMPIEKWLRGPLKDWAESLLQPSDLISSGLRADIVKKIWSEHQAGQNRQAMLWAVLMYRQWQQRLGTE
jgi:asparagine synthase (glutamine-hydrolysing)